MKFKSLGFTLIEIMVALFLFVTIISAITALAVYYFRTYSYSLEESASIGIAQTTLTQIIREIREARQSELGAWPLVETSDNSLIFYADVTNDGKVDRVRYFLEDSNIKKGVIEPSGNPVSYVTASEKITIVASSVSLESNSLFTYYNGSWPTDTVSNPLVSSARLLNTRHIKVYIRINITNGTGSQPFEVSSGVTIRSMKDNL